MTSPNQNWPAPTVSQPVRATVTVGGSKSITNRALVIAALSSTPSTLYGALRSRDSDLMIGALRAMGAEIHADSASSGAPNHTLKVIPHILHGGTVNCGLAGTVMRFVPPIAATAQGSVFFDGDAEARVRPMSAVLDALRGLGVGIDGDTLPFTVNPTQERLGLSMQPGETPDIGGEVTIDSSASSQFISGLLLSAARYKRGLRLRSIGEVPSRPHIDMTIAMLEEAGVVVQESHEDNADGGTDTVFTIEQTEIMGRDWHIEPDLSNATAFLAAAAVTGGTVTITDWPEHTTQPGDQIRPILEQMGARVELVERDGTGVFDLVVTGPEQLHGVQLDMSAVGELTPTVAAIAALADSPSELTGIAHLRGHETDRLAALTAEINKLGGSVEELPDGLRITPAPLHGGVWHSYHDHRMATAGAIIGLVVPGIEVENIGTTSKTMPNFDMRWMEMVGQATPSPQELAEDVTNQVDTHPVRPTHIPSASKQDGE